MIIGVDIDDTLANFTDMNLEYALKYDKTLRGNGIINNEEYVISKKFDWNEEERQKFRATYHRLFAPLMEPFANAKEVIEKLRNDGNKVIIISSRRREFYDDPYIMTINWLKRVNIVVDKVIVEAYPKKEVVVLEEKIDIFIDDVPKICDAVQKLGVKTYIYTSDANRDYVVDRVERVDNWKEFYNKVNEYIRLGE